MRVNFVSLSLHVKIPKKKKRQISLFYSCLFPKHNWLETRQTPHNVFLRFTDDWSPCARLSAISAFVTVQLCGAFRYLLKINFNHQNSLLLFSRTLNFQNIQFRTRFQNYIRKRSKRLRNAWHASTSYFKTVELFLWSNTESRGFKTSFLPVLLYCLF